MHCVLLHDGVSRKALVNKTAEVRFGKGSLISEGIFNWVPSSKNKYATSSDKKSPFILKIPVFVTSRLLNVIVIT